MKKKFSTNLAEFLEIIYIPYIAAYWFAFPLAAFWFAFPLAAFCKGIFIPIFFVMAALAVIATFWYMFYYKVKYMRIKQ